VENLCAKCGYRGELPTRNGNYPQHSTLNPKAESPHPFGARESVFVTHFAFQRVSSDSRTKRESVAGSGRKGASAPERPNQLTGRDWAACLPGDFPPAMWPRSGGVDLPRSGPCPEWNRTVDAGEGFGDVSDGAGSRRKTRRLSFGNSACRGWPAFLRKSRLTRQLLNGGLAHRLVMGRPGGVCLLRFSGMVVYRQTVKPVVHSARGCGAMASCRKGPVPGSTGHEADATTSKDDLCPGCVRCRSGS